MVCPIIGAIPYVVADAAAWQRVVQSHHPFRTPAPKPDFMVLLSTRLASTRYLMNKTIICKQ
jgi:hypothetical protein